MWKLCCLKILLSSGLIAVAVDTAHWQLWTLNRSTPGHVKTDFWQLCRFDLIYLVLDKAEEATDRKLARHLLSLHYERGQNAAQVGVVPTLNLAAAPIQRHIAGLSLHPKMLGCIMTGRLQLATCSPRP